MYSVCMFCNRTLGQNEVIETFPIGRRLAFDPDKGRLWVVCRKCERWNLTPMEERWEAIEDCERLFRDTRVRSSTDNVGLCRLTEGLELVRIGRPMRPEFAALEVRRSVRPASEEDDPLRRRGGHRRRRHRHRRNRHRSD